MKRLLLGSSCDSRNWRALTRSLQWRHNGRDDVSNHQPHDYLHNRLFRRWSKKTSKLRVTGLCAGNSPVTSEFPAQMASSAENVFIWWRHHAHHCACRWSIDARPSAGSIINSIMFFNQSRFIYMFVLSHGVWILYTCVLYHIIWCLNGNILVILCMHFILLPEWFHMYIPAYVLSQAWLNKTVETKPNHYTGYIRHNSFIISQ